MGLLYYFESQTKDISIKKKRLIKISLQNETVHGIKKLASYISSWDNIKFFLMRRYSN